MKKDNLNIYLTIVAVGLVASWWLVGAIETLILNPQEAIAQTTSTVTVSASITSVLSCSTATGTTSFGPLTSGVITTSSPDASTTMSCANIGIGCSLYVKDAGGGGNPGLWNSTDSYLIPSPAATATLSAGEEGYGIRATSTASGSGGALIVTTRYLRDVDGINSVGGLDDTNVRIASTTATSSGREIVVKHKAAISNVTKSGDYADTITYECTSN